MSDQAKRDLFAQMHALLDAGLDISRMFYILLDEYDGKKEHELLSLLFEAVIRGNTLKDAMMQSGEFTDLDFNVIGIGEASGRLSYTMRFLTEYYTKKVLQSKALRSALSYPIMILCFAFIVLAFMLIVIVPTFSQVYSRMGGELPTLTKIMIGLSANAPLVLSASSFTVIAVIALCWSQRNTKSYQKVKSSIMMNIPLVSYIVKADAQCTICRLMYLLTSSGVTMLESLEMVSHSMSILNYKEAISLIEERIKGGVSLSSCLAEYPLLFNRKLTAMIRVGEESNRLGDMFDRSANQLSDDLDSSFKSLSTYIEPLMVILVGGIVAVILIAMYLPMFRIGLVISG